MANFVYIGASLDGYIAARDGGIDWLDYVPVPEGDDLGFSDFMDRVDAVVMGRNTFDTLVGFGTGWHYPKPGIVLSTTLEALPEDYASQVQLASGTPHQIVELAKRQGFENLYIDGGTTVQRFLQEDLIDELIITTIPILLGGGVPLFGGLDKPVGFELVGTEVLLDQLVKRRYRRKRS